MDVSGCVLYDSFNNCQRCGGNTELQGTDCVGTINCLGYPYTEGIASRKCNACLPNMLLDQTTFKCTDTIADHCKTNTVAS